MNQNLNDTQRMIDYEIDRLVDHLRFTDVEAMLADATQTAKFKSLLFLTFINVANAAITDARNYQSEFQAQLRDLGTRARADRWSELLADKLAKHDGCPGNPL